MLGVWDTVGVLGVPAFSNTPLARAKYGFYDTSLGRVIEHAYHAVAIDEQREDYQVTLWEAVHPVGTREVEQRWFPGAHANVGGGYQDDLLPDPPLRWIAEKGIRHGLEFSTQFEANLGAARCKNALPEDFKLRGDEYLSPVRDSYREFLRGIYRFGRALVFRGRYYRPMLVGGVGETIDETAHMKWATDPRYRPKNFAFAGRRDVSLGAGITPASEP
jgi:T6SS, Phospholipase effector Tle1-like, catalytic domain